MPGYILKRLLSAVPVLLGLTLIAFAIMAAIPGDPATAILGSYATPENVEKLNRDLGLDKPLPQQYAIWLGNILQGDFGRSYTLNRPVIDEVLERFNATLILAGAAMLLCSFFGLIAGIVSAVRQFGWADRLITFVVLIGISIPSRSHRSFTARVVFTPSATWPSSSSRRDTRCSFSTPTSSPATT